MIGYLLLLTWGLPSSFASQPNWIEVGSYAEYTIEKYDFRQWNNVGTYAWRIISTYTDDNGELIARINETYTSDGEEDQRSEIVDIIVKDGLNERTPLWLNRYYNDYLIDISDFKIGNEVFGGYYLEEITVNDENRLSVKLGKHRAAYGPSTYYWFDRETGLFLKSAPGYKSGITRRVLKSTNIVNGSHNGKATTDLFHVAPLFIVPVVGATSGLLTIKRKGYKFSRQFWSFFVLFNGIILASVSNFPFRVPLGRFHISSYHTALSTVMLMLNAYFWIGVLVAIIFLIDRLAFPIILKQAEVMRVPTPRGKYTKAFFAVGGVGSILNTITSAILMSGNLVLFQLFHGGHFFVQSLLLIGLSLSAVGYLGLRRNYGSRAGLASFILGIIFSTLFIVFLCKDSERLIPPVELILLTNTVFGVMLALWGVTHVFNRRFTGYDKLATATGIMLIITSVLTTIYSPIVIDPVSIWALPFFVSEIMATILFFKSKIPANNRTSNTTF